MLNQHAESIGKQGGVVLLLTLIVLVAMTLAGLALTRSVDATNIIAGNLGFRQAATQSTDIGVEAAIEWLESNSGASLHNSDFFNGYSAASDQRDPPAGKSWDWFWTNVLVPNGQVATRPPDAAGNTVSYAIQRLCDETASGFSVNAAACALPSSKTITGQSKNGGPPLNYNNLGYYRITVRVDGPRNTVTYAQAIVGLLGL